MDLAAAALAELVDALPDGVVVTDPDRDANANADAHRIAPAVAHSHSHPDLVAPCDVQR